MAARSAWASAINFAGFPIHLKGYSIVSSSASASGFKNLCRCHGEPIKQHNTCATDGTILGAEDMAKGIALGKNDVRPVTAEQHAALTDADRTDTMEILGLPSQASIPEALTSAKYRIVPDDKVPGSEQPANILWNGLRASGRAVITEFSARAGTRPSLMAITADEHGLTGHALPYTNELNDVREHKFDTNEQAAQAFETFAASAGLSMDDFSHSAFVDTYAQRRDELIKQVLSGQTPVATSAPSAAAAVPDLMAAMSAALDKAKPAAKKPAARKAAKS